MNANELADAMDVIATKGTKIHVDTRAYITKAATMPRQQHAEIEALKAVRWDMNKITGFTDKAILKIWQSIPHPDKLQKFVNVIHSELTAKVGQQHAEIEALNVAIETALDWVEVNSRDKPYTDPDLCGEMVKIRLSGLCALATAIGKRDQQALADEWIRKAQEIMNKYSDIVSDGDFDPRNEYEAKRKPAELTDEDILKIWRENEKVYPMDRSRILDRSRACIRKAQESNNEQVPDFFFMENDLMGKR